MTPGAEPLYTSPMGKMLAKDPAALYERDFHAWLTEQARQLRGRSHNDIDWDNLAEEVESVARSERREIRSRLALLVQHLLKWQFQPGRRSESWRLTIAEQRKFILSIIEDSPSLSSFPAAVFAEEYRDGRRRALDETGIDSSLIPLEPPFSVEQALDSSFMPGKPLLPHEPIRD